jgi:hypothetical protein
MSGQLAVNLNRITMRTKKGLGECTVEFAATLATGTLEDLKPDEEQLLALPTELAQTCRRMIADVAMATMTVGSVAVPKLAGVQPSSKLRVETKREALLERLRVKKEEGKDHVARARLVFLVKLDLREEWPGRELLGKWLEMSLRDSDIP